MTTTNGLIHVLSAASDQLFRDLTADHIERLPVYQGELLMTTHGTGCYTSHPEMKQYNRQNEQRARLRDALEHRREKVDAEVREGEQDALAAKAPYATSMTTQLCFDPDAISTWPPSDIPISTGWYTGFPLSFRIRTESFPAWSERASAGTRTTPLRSASGTATRPVPTPSSSTGPSTIWARFS